jgi:transcription elongation factor GreA
MEMRISKLEQILANVQVIDPKDFPNDKIYILSQVRLLNKKTNKEIDYLLVSEEEADYDKNKIAVNSPIGKSLMGKKAGEIATVKVPAGTVEYEILSVTR